MGVMNSLLINLAYYRIICEGSVIEGFSGGWPITMSVEDCFNYFN